jgi:hypothetical protein
MSNQSKRARFSYHSNGEHSATDPHAHLNLNGTDITEHLHGPVLQENTDTTADIICRGLFELPISSWIESKKDSVFGTTSQDSLRLTGLVNNFDRSWLPNAENSASQPIDDAIVFPSSVVVSLGYQIQNGNTVGDGLDQVPPQVARLARKREINRQSAQRKRQREKDQLEFLSERHYQLRIKNEELKRESDRILEMIEMLKSGKVAPLEPIQPSLHTLPDGCTPKSTEQERDKNTSDLSARPDLLGGVAAVNLEQLTAPSAVSNWSTRENAIQTQSQIAGANWFGAPVVNNAISTNTSGSVQQLVVLLLAVLLQGKPEMIQVLKEFVDNEVARQRLLEEQRQKQFLTSIENNTTLSVLMGALLQQLSAPTGQPVQESSKNADDRTVQNWSAA